MGIPRVTIHFRLGFSLKKTIQRQRGSPMAMATPTCFHTFPQFWSIWDSCGWCTTYRSPIFVGNGGSRKIWCQEGLEKMVCTNKGSSGHCLELLGGKQHRGTPIFGAEEISQFPALFLFIDQYPSMIGTARGYWGRNMDGYTLCMAKQCKTYTTSRSI